MHRSRIFLLGLFFLFLCITTNAQKSKSGSKTQKPKTQKTASKPAPKPKTPPDIAADEKKVRDLVAFFQFMLNTLGGKQTSTRDKDVMITESYTKIFRDGKVQIEDDLDEERKVITNKDVPAYLKDVDYFFDDVKFEFAIEEVKANKQPNGDIYYEVKATRHLTGTNTDGKAVKNSMPRYIEVNYSPDDQDLKIVSVYTNEFDEKEALTQWWNELSHEWQDIFRKKMNLPDTVEVADIKKATSIQDLNLSSNMFIQNLDPLSQLAGLKSLDLSGTMIDDLTPLRNSTELTQLILSRSRVTDLSPLKYASAMKELDASFTGVTDISVLAKMSEMEVLSLRQIPASDFSAISNLTMLTTLNLQGTKLMNTDFAVGLTELRDLNLSGTSVADVRSLKDLQLLEVLDLDSTRIGDVQALSGLEHLKILSVSYTTVFDLSPLQKLPQLEKIYCDQSRVTQEALDVFTKANSKVLVVFDSKNLTRWWDGLTDQWRDILAKAIGVSAESMSKEQLTRVIQIDSINVSGKVGIRTLEPLARLPKVRVVIAERTAISDLSPLQNHREISYLDISETAVVDVTLLQKFPKLKMVKADKSKIEGVEDIVLPSVQRFYCDQTSMQDILAKEFLKKNSNCLLIYKTSHLERWWGELSETWKGIIREQAGKKGTLTREDLHKVVEQENLSIKDEPITSLSPLSHFVRLKELHFSGSALTSISVPDNILDLKSLRATHSPIRKLDSLSLFTQLEDLDLSDTPVDDIYPVWRLKSLKRINVAGTQIRRLDPLEKLENLEFVDCSNTNVNKLSALEYLPLKTLRCYNTKVSPRAIENFKASHPECAVMYYR